MRFYLASRYGRRAELCEYAADLMAHGHEVTSRWLFAEHEGTITDDTDSKYAQQNARFAVEDLIDVYKCDVMIQFGESPTDPPPGAGRGGRFVELGWAIAHEKTIIIVGVPENLFHYWPTIQCVPDWATAKDEIDTMTIFRTLRMYPSALQNAENRLSE